MVRQWSGGKRRGALPLRLLAGLGVLVWVVTALPVGPAAEAAGTRPAAVPAVVVPACPGCDDFTLSVPADPSEDGFGSEDNTTVEVVVRFPSGWSGLTCADKYGVVARRTLDPAAPSDVPVPGWRCQATDLNTLRFRGPGIAAVEDSAQRFTFQGRSPGQISASYPGFGSALATGFIEIVQTFRDGEQQRRRAMKQLEARRQAPTDALTTFVDLPPDWTGVCSRIGTQAKVGMNAAKILADGWLCDEIPGTGAHPRSRVQWVPCLTALTGCPSPLVVEDARYFDFEAFTAQEQPTLTPFTAVDLVLPDRVDRIRDLMFVSGEIRTARIAYVRAGTITPAPTSTATPGTTASPSPSPTPTRNYQATCPTPTPGLSTANLPAPGYPFGYAPAPGYQEGPYVYPYTHPNLPGGGYPFPGYPFAAGPGIDGLAHDPCAPPTVVLDPCNGEVYTKNGVRRYRPEDAELPEGCSLAPELRSQPISYRGTQACITTKPEDPGARPPDDFDPELGPPEARASRSNQREPLAPNPVPTGPPTIMVPARDAAQVTPVPGSDERILTVTAGPTPAPTIRALLPDVSELPYCEDLPDTGSNSGGLLRLALLTFALGCSLLGGAMYWRRRSPHGVRYTRS